ncbi:MAG: HRDC domain-containing protein [Acidimicrobiales bacterium]|nr:HRDC domain-containing protein [Acidimicrobiales bacterium]
MSGTEHRWVDRPEQLAEVVESLLGEPAYAVDTEFHRERTYFPKVALVQLAGPRGVALVDALAVDLAPLGRLLDGSGTAVMHAAGQDLEVLDRACGTVPTHLFDTQVAAGFVGYGTPSLVALLSGELGVKVPKGDRLTDWLRRPLTADQRAYAASDVAHLLALHRRLVERLEERGRLGWALDECDELRLRPVGGAVPEEAWLRLKEHRHLRGTSRGVAQAVAAWRERRAARLDQPVRQVLPDLALVSIAQRPPRTLAELQQVRGLDGRHTRGPVGEELLAAVAEGLRLPADQVQESRGEDLPRHLRPAVTLVSAWVSQLARDAELDTALLATRSDLVELLGDPPSGRLTHGWRAELAGEAVRKLVRGEAALAFDGRGNLVLEARSARPLQG